jgi:hypothetical protein
MKRADLCVRPYTIEIPFCDFVGTQHVVSACVITSDPDVLIS